MLTTTTNLYLIQQLLSTCFISFLCVCSFIILFNILMLYIYGFVFSIAVCFDLLITKYSVLPVSNTRVDCFSDISIVSCERWSSSQTHPVSAACTHIWQSQMKICVWVVGGVFFYCTVRKGSFNWRDCSGGCINNNWWQKIGLEKD